MRNLKIIMSYNGTNYCGFQTQTNASTIQSAAETALFKLLKEKTGITGCSRTDSGVHARGFVFNLRTSNAVPCDGFVKGFNALLPKDIAVHSCEEVDESFHARYSAKSKEYVYLIHNGNTRDVFMQDLAYFYPRRLNISIMQEAAALFAGEHDFAAYCKTESLEITRAKKRGTIREIYGFQVMQKGEYVELVVNGNGFLHNMVRILAGTLINVSEGKLSIGDVQKSLKGLERNTAGVTLPACGLYLNRVFYDEKK
jgi:tRNA pseudouridine38-40 synthase